MKISEFTVAATGRQVTCRLGSPDEKVRAAEPGLVLALRLTADDERIAGVAGIAPVTDWRILKEFEEVRERDDVAALALKHRAASLAGRPVYLAIGSHDHRVGTHACVDLAHAILECEEPEAEGESQLNLHVVDSPGHTLERPWRERGVRFLLNLVSWSC